MSRALLKFCKAHGEKHFQLKKTGIISVRGKEEEEKKENKEETLSLVTPVFSIDPLSSFPLVVQCNIPDDFLIWETECVDKNTQYIIINKQHALH